MKKPVSKAKLTPVVLTFLSQILLIYSFQNTSTMTTGLSVFHIMVVTFLKTTFLKSKPKVITYRDYRTFDNDKFKTDLKIL